MPPFFFQVGFIVEGVRLGYVATLAPKLIEIDLCRSRGEELLHDRRVAADVAKWVQDRVFPKKGRR